jgi:hypothetical protein
MGGGAANTVSLLELLRIIEAVHGKRPELEFADWRAADQLYYVSDTRKFSQATGWKPKVSATQGIGRLYHWLLENVDSASIVKGRWENLAEISKNARNGSSRQPVATAARSANSSAPRSKRLLQSNGRSKKLMAA